MDKKKYLVNKYDRVMPRVYNCSRSSLQSTSFVTRHQTQSSTALGGKSSVSHASSTVYSDLPIVLNDYKCDEKPAKRPFVVKPRRTLKSLDPALSPPRSVRRSQELRPKPSRVRARGSAPSVLARGDDMWPETHMRQCLSSRSHTKLKELKDEIKAYQETEKLMRLRCQLYKSCGVVLDDIGQIADDKAVQVELATDQIQNIESFPRDPVLKGKWIELTRRENWFPTKASKVCSRHFTEDDFHVFESGRRRLFENAIPSKHLPLVGDSTETPKTKSSDAESSSQSNSSSNKQNIIFEHVYCAEPYPTLIVRPLIPSDQKKRKSSDAESPTQSDLPTLEPKVEPESDSEQDCSSTNIPTSSPTSPHPIETAIETAEKQNADMLSKFQFDSRARLCRRILELQDVIKKKNKLLSSLRSKVRYYKAKVAKLEDKSDEEDAEDEDASNL